MDNLLVKK